MTARHSHIFLVFAAFITGLVVFLGVFFYAAGEFGVGPAHAAIGGPFNLIDQNGKSISEKDFKGKPLIVFFGYTHCPDICPTTLFELSQVLHAMGKSADQINALFVTIDPERDTPAVMKDYLSSFDSHLRGATGSQQQIDAVEKEYRVYAKKVPEKNGDYSMDHSAVVYLMNKEGQFVAPFNLQRKPADEVEALRKYL